MLRPHLERVVFGIVGDQCQQRRSEALAIGGVDDHLHVLVHLHPMVAVADLVRACKSVSAEAMQREARHGVRFRWQRGYAVLSVDPQGVPAVVDYVHNQREHHARGGLQSWMEPDFPTDGPFSDD